MAVGKLQAAGNRAIPHWSGVSAMYFGSFSRLEDRSMIAVLNRYEPSTRHFQDTPHKWSKLQG
ncbi:hypothetical protein ASG42_27035 [Rhizobium sp. Leaf391]|nr:hypothetical protein ASG42_27035 [Rhizobium sp. Leaf391]